ncbi:HEAT repeat domain-containing protein [Kitasatospora sp. NBC_01266]|uniref:HEAT repeat domain-containing protein n=1 Tax=Kitasatospora sp. NBC_01266 TaxID=2903572 RepID=UPI002E37B11C|nr:HEAT repeat domain-containing protein [Kitasatospora sp. NBC_01266]
MEMESLINEAWRPTTTTPRLRELAAEDPRLARIVAGRIGLSAEFAEELAAWADSADAHGAVTDGADTGLAEANLNRIGMVRALAAQPATSPERLALYAGHPDEQVRHFVALHRGTPKAALEMLAADDSPAVRWALAAREELPEKIADKLLTDSAADVRLALIQRSVVQEAHLQALATDPDPRIRRVVAELGYAGDADLLDEDPRVRQVAVRSRDLDALAAHLERLVRDPDQLVRELCASSERNRDGALLAVLATDSVPAVRKEVAANWHTPVESLIALAGDECQEVLEVLSKNPFAPPQALSVILETVPQDFDSLDHSITRFIIYNLLRNPAISCETMRALYAKNPFQHVKVAALSEPNCPPDVALRFAVDYYAHLAGNDEARRSFADVEAALRDGRPLGPVLAELLSSPDHYLRGVAAANRHTPPEALAHYAHTTDPKLGDYSLNDVAKNPATPLEILEDWARADERQSKMLGNPYLPESVFEIIATGEDERRARVARRILAVRTHRAGTEHTC